MHRDRTRPARPRRNGVVGAQGDGGADGGRRGGPPARPRVRAGARGGLLDGGARRAPARDRTPGPRRPARPGSTVGRHRRSGAAVGPPGRGRGARAASRARRDRAVRRRVGAHSGARGRGTRWWRCPPLASSDPARTRSGGPRGQPPRRRAGGDGAAPRPARRDLRADPRDRRVGRPGSRPREGGCRKDPRRAACKRPRRRPRPAPRGPRRLHPPRSRLRLGGARRMTGPVTWTPAADYHDIRYEHSGTGVAKVTIDRPEVRNAFRPETVAEMIDAFAQIRDDATIGCVLLTGAGDVAFGAGGDQNARSPAGGYVGGDGLARLNVLDLQRQIRSLPIPVIALVNGFAIGGGQVLHVVCDLTIASDNAVFGQVGPRVGSFDAGFGIGLLARLVGDKKAKEIWFLCRRYSAAEALAMGLVNAVVPLADLEAEGARWADEILAMSPTAIRFLKSAFLVATDGLAGLQEFAGNATGLYYTTEEAHEGSRAFLDKRDPDYSKYPRRP